ncbi:MAG: 50S ribosomal protein L2 [Candidatus Diapherotrites archaeon]|uniref:50S ribosomal protein L2 n=1 Tax=Candidatus Iainarchaeum sp. TaxID=3101447 RepID=A0A2D6LPL0_9ARCH|nr:50S ribosomal protein L2 [Candidatus Diapherotrites archaeon]|tara:strand:+ start:3861 stop:4580 length:720 start_codon:yes stop_codon:yes gene_type:complete
MPKRLKSQRRGKGSPVFVATNKGAAPAQYVDYTEMTEKTLKGEVVGLIHDPARTAVLSKIEFDNGSQSYSVAAEGMFVGQKVEYGTEADLQVGNVKPIGNCVEGCPIFNVEKTPGDGGSLVRSSGTYALIVTKDKKTVYVKMPSGKTMELNPKNRATIGCVGSGGRREKPFVKAGKKHFAMRAKHKKYPTVRGIAMNAKDHPFGGANHHPGKSKSTSRRAAPGRKVGDVASSRTGRKKK